MNSSQACRLDLGASLGGQPWPPGQTRILREGDQVSFGRRRRGARAYLAMAGGFRLERVLGSRTTNLHAGFGGWHGHRLEKGDLLPLMGSFANPPWLLIPDSLAHVISAAPLRMVQGRDCTTFTGAAQTALHESSFTVIPQSDRMGYRLQGPTLQLAAPYECLSEAVAFGGAAGWPVHRAYGRPADHRWLSSHGPGRTGRASTPGAVCTRRCSRLHLHRPD